MGIKRFFNIYYQSFFSRQLYRDVASKWEGTGLLYLFFAIAFVLIFPVTSNMYILSGVAEKSRDEIDSISLFGANMELAPIVDLIEEFPEVRVEGGRAFTDVEQPYIIDVEDPRTKEKQNIIVIDTTGQITNTDQSESVILITADSVITNEGKGNEVKRLEFSKLQDMYIDKYMLYGWLKWQPLIYYPGILFFHFVVFSINALIFGLFGYGLCRTFGLDMYYKDNIRLAAVTSTPVVTLDALASSTGLTLFANPSFIYLLAHAAYMYHAVESNKK